MAYNRAIDDALFNYHKGIGAIRALKVKQVVTVQHIGRGTKQEVTDIGTEEDSTTDNDA